MDPLLLAFERTCACDTAAATGQLDVLVDFHTRGLSPWNEETVAAAARNGHFHVVRWLSVHECPCDWKAGHAAAKNGHLNIIRWLYDHGYPVDWSVTYAAAYNGDMEILQWAYETAPFVLLYWTDISIGAFESGNLHVLRWLCDHKCPVDYQAAYKTAARHGRVNILCWLQENGPPPLERQFIRKTAAYHGHLNVLIWVRENKYHIEGEACKWAAKGGHVHILEWIYENDGDFKDCDDVHPDCIDFWKTYAIPLWSKGIRVPVTATPKPAKRETQ